MGSIGVGNIVAVAECEHFLKSCTTHLLQQKESQSQSEKIAHCERTLNSKYRHDMRIATESWFNYLGAVLIEIQVGHQGYISVATSCCHVWDNYST